MNMAKRKYNKTLRAEQQGETRERIIKATVALHEQLGPANTSIKAIAEKAGVQRLTVYRHFPDEASLFQACTSHYLGQHPPPRMGDWAKIEDASQRTRAVLLAFYRYYRRTERMWDVAYRDIEKVEALKGPMRQFEAYLDQVRDDLVSSWKLKLDNKKSLALTLRHCLRFSTWASLKNENLSDKKITELVMGWIHH
jgi:AcrR family transcriptional regulator